MTRIWPTRIEVVDSTYEHVLRLAPCMRQEDAAEVLASAGYDPLTALEKSLEASTVCRSMLVGGRVAAMWGVAPAPGSDEVGVVWLLSTRLVERYRKSFWRICQSELAEFQRHYPVLMNAVDDRYKTALRWVRRLGFHVDDPRPFGVEGRPFRRIFIVAPEGEGTCVMQ